jgi:hypothetical protein
MLRRGLVLAAAALPLAWVACQGPTAVRVIAYTEVPCDTQAPVAVVVASDLAELNAKLAAGIVSSTRAGCSGGLVGDVVVTPPGARDGSIAFALLTRADGQTPDRCGDPTLGASDSSQCIVAKRALRFRSHEQVDVRVDLRGACRGIACAAEQTCVKGTCVSAQVSSVCAGACTETDLTGDAGAPQSRALSVSTFVVETGSDAGAATSGVTACAEGSDGRAYCWGANGFGQLGAGVVGGGSGTVSPLPVTEKLRSISVGTGHVCAVHEGPGGAGQVSCWGRNNSGQVGDDTLVDRERPVRVGPFNAALEVAAGDGFSCAIDQDRAVWCWGSNASGELGDGATTTRRTPVKVVGNLRARHLSAGLSYACAADVEGVAWCWGANGSGQAGQTADAGASRRIAQPLVGLPPVDRIACGQLVTCALLMNGGVRCWGANANGESGDGTTQSSAAPVPVSGLSDAVAISRAYRYSCALRATGALTCWGTQSNGEFGVGSPNISLVPWNVSGVSGATALAAGAGSVCAVVDGGVVCWGSNAEGQLGDGLTAARPEPAPVLGVP